MNDLAKLRDQLNKEFQTKVTVGAGVRSEIKEAHLEVRTTIDKVKVFVKNDLYEEYNSAKVLVSNLDETLIAGVGQDYALLEAKNIADTGIGIFAQKSIDEGSKSTVTNELIYEKFGFTYSRNIKELFTFI